MSGGPDDVSRSCDGGSVPRDEGSAPLRPVLHGQRAVHRRPAGGCGRRTAFLARKPQVRSRRGLARGPPTLQELREGRVQMSQESPSLAGGTLVDVRGDRWRVVETVEHDDCSTCRLVGASASNIGVRRTLLLPFDRPRPVVSRTRVRRVGRRRWMAGLRAVLGVRLPRRQPPWRSRRRHRPARLPARAGDRVRARRDPPAPRRRSRPWQDDPGRADPRRPSRSRRVGPRARPLPRRPLRAVAARTRRPVPDHGGGRRPGRACAACQGSAADVGPWEQLPMAVASIDFVKRPEVLRSMEAVRWDLLIVDEAHLCAVAPERAAAVNWLAKRARRVVLMTATPHPGEPGAFEALCRIGRLPGEGPALMFRRTRAELGLASGPALPDSGRHLVCARAAPSRAARALHVARVGRGAAAAVHRPTPASRWSSSASAPPPVRRRCWHRSRAVSGGSRTRARRHIRNCRCRSTTVTSRTRRTRSRDWRWRRRAWRMSKPSAACCSDSSTWLARRSRVTRSRGLSLAFSGASASRPSSSPSTATR